MHSLSCWNTFCVVLVRWLVRALRLASISPAVYVLDDGLPSRPRYRPNDLLITFIDLLMQRMCRDQRPVAGLERLALAAVRAKDDCSGAGDGVDDLCGWSSGSESDVRMYGTALGGQCKADGLACSYCGRESGQRQVVRTGLQGPSHRDGEWQTKSAAPLSSLCAETAINDYRRGRRPDLQMSPQIARVHARLAQILSLTPTKAAIRFMPARPGNRSDEMMGFRSW